MTLLPEERNKICSLAVAGESEDRIADLVGHDKKTVVRWIGRYCRMSAEEVVMLPVEVQRLWEQRHRKTLDEVLHPAKETQQPVSGTHHRALVAVLREWSATSSFPIPESCLCRASGKADTLIRGRAKRRSFGRRSEATDCESGWR